ncbi:MAG: preprotein translocase subunit SecE [Gammaproteobacteria bacterium]|nr:preprotein translocase subunit SecE [Gammaproteobacteria bacterium]
MAEKIDDQASSLDWVKWALVVALVAAGVYANSFFAAESLLLRTIGILILAGLTGWIAAQTTKGRSFVDLCLEARVEIRKVVWPTRQETTQTTIVVLIVVFVVALILWLLDWGLNGLISVIIG